MALANKARVLGGGYTLLRWHGDALNGGQVHDIAYCQQMSHQSPAPVAEPVAIQPLNEHRPLEIITTRAIRHGVLTVTLIELWNQPIWDHLRGLGGTDMADLGSILRKIANRNQELTIETIIQPPVTINGGKTISIAYHGVAVADMRDDYDITIESMASVNKTITFWYTDSQYESRDRDGSTT